MSLGRALFDMRVDRTASGYELLKLFDTSLAHVWPASQSQVYGELAKLADTGLGAVVAQGTPGRTDYALTDAGMAELRRWLAETPPDQPARSEVQLRVFFLDL